LYLGQPFNAVENRGGFRGHRIVRVRIAGRSVHEAPDFEVRADELHAAPTLA